MELATASVCELSLFNMIGSEWHKPVLAHWHIAANGFGDLRGFGEVTVHRRFGTVKSR